MKKLGFLPFGTYSSSEPLYPFGSLFGEAVNLLHDVDSKVADCDAVVVWGGEDVSPALYGQEISAHRSCYARTPGQRDTIEQAMMREAVRCDVPIIGVCRGAQLACAVAGGILVQHASGHQGSHLMTTNDNRQIVTSSVHHQMMYPWEVPHELIAWSTENRSNEYWGAGNTKLEQDLEPEIVWFPTINALAIQGHPEFMDEDCEFNVYVRELISKYVLELHSVE